MAQIEKYTDQLFQELKTASEKEEREGQALISTGYEPKLLYDGSASTTRNAEESRGYSAAGFSFAWGRRRCYAFGF